MTRTAIILIAAFAFFLSGCSAARKTAAAETQAKAQLTAATAGQRHAESTGQNAIIANVQTGEKKNVVIDFAAVEFYPGEVPAFPSDSARAGWLNAAVSGGPCENPGQVKPQNVKSVTKGRAVINGEKTEKRAAKSTSETSATEESAINAEIKAQEQEAAETKTEKKPKYAFWDWLYLITAGGVSVCAAVLAVKFARKIRNAADKGG